MVANSTERVLSAPAACNRDAILLSAAGLSGWLLVTIASAAINDRASPAKVKRTLWITERSATMAPTPTAMHTKKNRRRFHDARISRAAMTATNLTALRLAF